MQIIFDETGICLFQDSTCGHAVAAARARKRRGQSLPRDVKRAALCSVFPASCHARHP